MVGATAGLAGVSRMTGEAFCLEPPPIVVYLCSVALVVIMFELTGGLNYILPFMISAAVAKWLACVIFQHSRSLTRPVAGLPMPSTTRACAFRVSFASHCYFILTYSYDAHIHLNGFPYLDAKDEFPYYTKAKDAMQPPPNQQEHPLTCITMRETIGDLGVACVLFMVTYCLIASSERLFHKDSVTVNGFPVVTSQQERRIVGYVTKRDVREKLGASKACVILFV